jgi:hypothetical protein
MQWVRCFVVIPSIRLTDFSIDMVQLLRNPPCKNSSVFSSREKNIRIFLLGLHSNNLRNKFWILVPGAFLEYATRWRCTSHDIGIFECLYDARSPKYLGG